MLIFSFLITSNNHYLGGSKGGARDACRRRIQILSISCIFWENLEKSYIGSPAPRMVGAPSYEGTPSYKYEHCRFSAHFLNISTKQRKA